MNFTPKNLASKPSVRYLSPTTTTLSLSIFFKILLNTPVNGFLQTKYEHPDISANFLAFSHDPFEHKYKLFLSFNFISLLKTDEEMSLFFSRVKVLSISIFKIFYVVLKKILKIILL